MFTKKYFKSFNFSLVILVTILVVFGIIAIGSAIHINLGEDASDRNSQIFFFSIGFILMLIVTFIDYNFIGKFYLLIYIFNILLLIAVLVFGTRVNDATRWIRIGGVGIQPSEFSKVMMIIAIAKLIDKKKDDINNIFVLIMVMVFGLIPVLLIQKQPSLSASLVIVAILIIMIFVAKISYKYVITVGALGIGGIAFVLWDIQRQSPILVNKILRPFQITRILTILSPEAHTSTSYYQTQKSMSAIGSGQLYGKGLYQGTLNQLSYLPEPHNDFIFSVIGEEFGFVGCSVILGLLFLIIVKCIIIAVKAEDFYGRCIAIGIAGMFAFQTFVHVGVTTGFLPNTGMPLPFVSYGGSSLWTNMIAIGLVLNVGIKRSKTLF
jgi:rod shape determining protein RodA